MVSAVSQNFVTSTFTPVQFTAASLDPTVMWSAVTPTRVTPKSPGWYDVTGSIGFTLSGAGTRIARLSLNGVEVVRDVRVPSATNEGVVKAGELIAFNGTTDYVELEGWQNSGATIGYSVGAPTQPRLVVRRVRDL